MNTNYEKDLNDLKEQILKEGNTSVTKRDLLERFCEIDKEYNGEPWNLLQILSNINILIGEEPCENAVSKTSVFEIMGNLMSIPYDLDRPINKKDVSKSMNEIRALPPVTPTQKEGMQDSILDKIKAEIKDLDIFYDNDYFSSNRDAMFKCSEVLQIIDKYKAEGEK